MRVAFHKPSITEKEIKAVSKVLRSGHLTMGLKTLEFESLFSAYIENSYAVAFNSCTAALHCALHILGIKEEDEVIIPTTTYVATAEAVIYCKATPVFVDIDRKTHCIDPDKIAEKITNKTKAIIPVHYAGHSCDMDIISKIAKDNNLYVIQDAAHALPSWYYEKKIGSFGDITCFSFYATKTITTGEGGMLVTSNEEWANKAKLFRLHGVVRDVWNGYSGRSMWQYDVECLGYKYNTTDINSAIGIEQLCKVESLWRKRTNIAVEYFSKLKDNKKIIPYVVEDYCVSSWHLYPLKLNINKLPYTRDDFVARLYDRGVSTSVHFIPLYRMKYFADDCSKYPESEWVFSREVSLPIYPGMAQKEVAYVIETILVVLDEI